MTKMTEDKSTKMTQGELGMNEPYPTDQDLDDLDTVNEWLNQQEEQNETGTTERRKEGRIHQA